MAQGRTVGVVGAGQLARMMALAGAPLNISISAYDVNSDSIVHPLTQQNLGKGLANAIADADVVTAESGGVQLDTLFVDEGFGSLDADTLDDVMDTLDALRDGGRVVGVVSHVAEMRDRIPAQVRLVKSPAGSRLTQTDG